MIGDFRAVGEFRNEELEDVFRRPGDAALVAPRRGVPSREASRERLRRLEGDPGILPFDSFLAGLLAAGLRRPVLKSLLALGLAARLPAFGLAAIPRLGLAALLPSLGLGARLLGLGARLILGLGARKLFEGDLRTGSEVFLLPRDRNAVSSSFSSCFIFCLYFLSSALQVDTSFV